MQLSFSKYEGLGNDFVLIDASSITGELQPSHAVALCDRHLGIGGDGVLVVGTAGPRPSMKVINADGSIPEMCGNGIRCVALHLFLTGRGEAFEIDTDAGIHACRIVTTGETAQVEVTMRARSLEPASLPLKADGPLVDAPFPVGGRTLHVTALSMGNPHVVTFDDVGAARAELGPLLERDPRFPSGVNVGFARMTGPRAMQLAVFERGAGWTRACGTGACAAAIAAVETRRAPLGAPIEVELPGGVLSIFVSDPSAAVRMTGPARRVFDGSVAIG